MKGAMSVKSPSSSIGEAPFTASRVPKSALHARKMPCPMTTPGLPVSRPYISAMMEPTCSWRTRTVWIAFESWSGAAAGHAEDELDARLLEDADDGVGDVDLVGNHARPPSARAGATRSARPRPSPGTLPRRSRAPPG